MAGVFLVVQPTSFFSESPMGSGNNATSITEESHEDALASYGVGVAMAFASAVGGENPTL